jgi:fructose-specific phosphotransferase system IIC component
MKSIIGLVVIVVVVGGLLFALNPTMDDFSAHLQRQAEVQASKSVQGGLGKALGSLAGVASGLSAKAYARKDYVVFSTYTLGKASDPGSRYLGVAKVFIKLK